MNDVGGQKLLHLQCHFGLETLSWARKGAIVTGMDISPAAIKTAVEIRDETRLPGDFVCSDVYSFDRGEQPEYDIVYTSYGSVGWLPDLEAWANVIAANLRVGGIFYMAEFHPLYDLVSGFSYFHSPNPDVEEKGTYTENCTGAKTKLITWAHPLSQVVNALVKNGVRIDHLNEYPFSPYNCFPGMEEREQGRFYIDYSGHDIPLVYTIKATKVA
jgi:2-polyprenyl-3-methyl-5-hydroxy-6-metoxy-1,4-benzoquinol methylase